MKNKKNLLRLICLMGSICAVLTACASPTDSTENNKITSEAITREILVNSEAFANLKELVSAGPRLSGSEGAARAVEWAKAKLNHYGVDQVWLQEVMVPHWQRGHHEDAIMTAGATGHLKVAALGNSIGTTEKGVEAEVIEVSSLKEATEKSPELKGKIVFFNGPMDPTLVDTFEAYGQSVPQRGHGPALAAHAGAVAVLVRSMTLNHDLHAHTGMTSFKEGEEKIPAATIATADADRLSLLLKTQKIRVKLFLSAQPMEPVKSYNVVGELIGSEFPKEYIDVGGHLDSWDLGAGAQDDGAGVVQTLEILRTFKALQVKPKRSIRFVLFMAEEFGGIGAREYAKQARLKKENHIAALESDSGGFTPRGFNTNAKGKTFAKISSWKKYLAPLGADRLNADEDVGTDIEPLSESGTILFGLDPDSSRYFDYHHTEIDTIEAVNPRELNLGASAMAVLIYLISKNGV